MLTRLRKAKRGGHLYCNLLDNGRISISGAAALVAISEIVADLPESASYLVAR